LALLELYADRAAQRVVVVRRVQAEHADPAAVRGTQTHHALHRGGFAGAVGSEYPEDLARLDGERHVLYRDPVAVRLA
jgi:hypothetical protein